VNTGINPEINTESGTHIDTESGTGTDTQRRQKDLLLNIGNTSHNTKRKYIRNNKLFVGIIVLCIPAATSHLSTTERKAVPRLF
jgi:hypothetical protein